MCAGSRVVDPCGTVVRGIDMRFFLHGILVPGVLVCVMGRHACFC
jgi:hypothetical protein